MYQYDYIVAFHYCDVLIYLIPTRFHAPVKLEQTMNAYDLSHLPDGVVLGGLTALVAQDRTTTANLLAHLAEVDSRRLYAPAGYSSMHAYCVEGLGLSDDATWKRLQVARRARKFPQILASLAEGRVHLSGLTLLAPHFKAGNVDDLLAAASGRRKSEIEILLATRFPQVEALRLDDGICALPTSPPVPVMVTADPQPAPGQVTVPTRVAPITAQRFAVQVTIDRETHDLLRYAQDLLGHAVPSGDVPEVLKRALEALIVQLEKRKFGCTDRPRQAHGNRASAGIS
jgi:hypothetical protein